MTDDDTDFTTVTLPVPATTQAPVRTTARPLSARVRRFIELRVNGVSVTHAYGIAYGQKNADAASACGSRLQRRPDVAAAIHEGVRARLTSLAVEAVDRLGSLVQSPDEKIGLGASKAVLDRSGMAAERPADRRPALGVIINIMPPEPHR
jgi:hypothetical protein